MKTDWREFCTTDGLACLDDSVEVRFESGRSQRVKVEDRGDAFLLCSIVARRSVVGDIPNAAHLAWVRNRSVMLAGFRVDEGGRMVGELWVPKDGLVASEFQFLLRHLAVESDRFEFQLTGRDYE